MSKSKYPKYINGIKQVQNPIARFCIKLWYSDWFRCIFIICPIWLFTLMVVFMCIFPDASEFIRYACIFCYLILFITGLICNDYSNLNKIGLDVYHKPLKDEYID